MCFGHKGIYREFGRAMKEDGVKAPIILAGSMDDPQMACDSLGTDCDMIGLGRPLLADPEWPNKVQTNHVEDIRPCLSCHAGCMARIECGQQISYAVNPACGRERAFRLVPTAQPKRVLVVGGGVGGMEAARVCALRGHDVTLWEKSDRLDGELYLSGAPDFKKDDLELLAWYKRQVAKLPIKVELNRAASAKEIDSSNYDMLKDLLAYNKVTVYESTSADHVTDEGLVVKHADGTQQTIPCDTVVESLGYRSDDGLYQELHDSDKLVYNIGDSNKVGLIMNAIWDAYQLSMEL